MVSNFREAPTHEKMLYEYNRSDEGKLIMVLVTGITNFLIIPSLVVMFKQKRHIELNVGIFTMTTSLAYHTLDSLALPTFIFSVNQWHILDNIGSINCMQMAMIHLMKIDDTFMNESLKIIGLLITIFF